MLHEWGSLFLLLSLPCAEVLKGHGTAESSAEGRERAGRSLAESPLHDEVTPIPLECRQCCRGSVSPEAAASSLVPGIPATPSSKGSLPRPFSPCPDSKARHLRYSPSTHRGCSATMVGTILRIRSAYKHRYVCCRDTPRPRLSTGVHRQPEGGTHHGRGARRVLRFTADSPCRRASRCS